MHDYRNTLILPACTCTMVIQKKIHSHVYYVLHVHVFGKLKKYAYFNTLLEGMDQKG